MARSIKTVDVKRDARINLAFTPELKKQLEDIANVDEVSMNALIEQICENYVKRRAEDLEELKRFRARIREKSEWTSEDRSLVAASANH